MYTCVQKSLHPRHSLLLRSHTVGLTRVRTRVGQNARMKRVNHVLPHYSLLCGQNNTLMGYSKCASHLSYQAPHPQRVVSLEFAHVIWTQSSSKGMHIVDSYTISLFGVKWMRNCSLKIKQTVHQKSCPFTFVNLGRNY